MIVVRNIFILLGTCIVLTGCFTQSAAPVIEGRLYKPEQVKPAQRTAYIPPVQEVHEVQQGDTLSQIATHYGVTTEDLIEYNQLSSADYLRVGMKLKVSNTGAMEPAVKQTTQSYSLTRKNIYSPSVNEKVIKPKPLTGWPYEYGIHQVQKGDNLYRIGLRYGIPHRELMVANGMKTPALNVGQNLRVPKGAVVKTKSIVKSTLKPRVKEASVTTKKVKPVKRTASASSKGLIWPVKGDLIKSFGDKGNGVTNTGINIRVPANTPIVAASDGTVIYSDDGLQSYGNLILVRHAGGIVTAYGHNSQNMVKKNERVYKGQVIALAGKTGGVTETQVHFEVRKNAQPVDPLKILRR